MMLNTYDILRSWRSSRMFSLFFHDVLCCRLVLHDIVFIYTISFYLLIIQDAMSREMLDVHRSIHKTRNADRIVLRHSALPRLCLGDTALRVFLLSFSRKWNFFPRFHLSIFFQSFHLLPSLSWFCREKRQMTRE